MGFFDKTNNTSLQNGWLAMTTHSDLDEAIKQSFDKPVILFKHSIRCGISVGAKYALEDKWDFKEDEMIFYYLDLINYREISNTIADKLNVIHQSPQMIILRNGKVVHSSTHHAIGIPDLKQGLEKAG